VDAYGDPEPSQDPKVKLGPAPLLGYAGIALLTGGVLLYLVVFIRPASASVITPFLSIAGGAAGAGAAGVALGFGARRLKLPAAWKIAAVLVAFVIMAAAGGAYKYGYGSTGALTIDLQIAPDHMVQGEVGASAGNVTITNGGPGTARVNPHFAVVVADPGGIPVLRFAQGCPFVTPPPPTEAQLVEVASGSSISWAFRIPIVWADSNGAFDASTAPCGAAILRQTGVHTVTATFSSFAFDAPGLPPVWSGDLTSARLPLTVS
jgi:hypothetical protein